MCSPIRAVGQRNGWRQFVLVVLVACGASLLAQAPDGRRWNRAYRDGEQELKAGRYQEAERSFKRAEEADLSPKRRLPDQLIEGTDRDKFYPEYFRAVAILNQTGREGEALSLFERVKRETLVPRGSGEAKELEGFVQQAHNTLSAAAAVQPKPGLTAAATPAQEPKPDVLPIGAAPNLSGAGDVQIVPPVGFDRPTSTATITSPPPPPRVGPSTSSTTTFDVLLQRAREALSARRFEEARTTAQQASSTGVDAAKADTLLKDIDRAERLEPVRLAKGRGDWRAAHTLLAGYRTTFVRDSEFQRLVAEVLDHLEGAGIAAFFRGQYGVVLSMLEGPAQDPSVNSPRIYFYLACANAALAQLPGEDRAARERAARDYFRRVRSLDTLQRDLTFVSPKIRDWLRQSG